MVGAENLLCEISITDTAVLLFFYSLIGNKIKDRSRAKAVLGITSAAFGACPWGSGS